MITKDVVFAGGKSVRHETWIYHNAQGIVPAGWSLTETPTIGPNRGLGAGARGASTSVGGAASSGKAIGLQNAALFAGGIGPRPDFTNASPQAYFYDFTADEWTGLEMGSPRAGHTLTTLLDGRILIVGGWNGARVAGPRGQNQPSLSSTELFDPVARTFRPGGTLLTARSGHAAARLADGQVLIVGGSSGIFDNDDSLVRSAEIYDPATDSFTATGGMLVTVNVPVATTLDDGRVLVLGDINLKRAEVFDPATGTFSSVGNMTAIHGFGATATKLNDGRVLILGGSSSDGFGVNPTAAAEVFDPVGNTFAALAPMRIRRESHLAILQDDGTVLVAGGNSAEITTDGTNFSVTSNDSALSDSFDPTTNTFTPLPDMPGTSSEGAGVFLKR